MKKSTITKLLDNSSTMTRELIWKGVPIPGYTIRSDGVLFHNGRQTSSWQINGRNYSLVKIDDHYWTYRLDYMVAYTFIGMKGDAIRLIHMNEDLTDDRLENLMWYRAADVLDQYKSLAIIEQDGSIIEEWLPCQLEFNPTLRYEVSNFGMIRDENHKLVQLHDSHGYRVFYYLDGSSDKRTRIKSVHRAVAEAFIPNPNNYALVNHLDGVGTNDVVYNLEWATTGMNMEHAYLQKLNSHQKYTLPQIHAVCDLLAHRAGSQVQISNMTGVDRKTISDIIRGRRWKDVSSTYIFRPKKWDSDTKTAVVKMICEGKTGKEIFVNLKRPYDQAAVSFYERMRRELKSKGLVV